MKKASRKAKPKFQVGQVVRILPMGLYGKVTRARGLAGEGLAVWVTTTHDDFMEEPFREDQLRPLTARERGVSAKGRKGER